MLYLDLLKHSMAMVESINYGFIFSIVEMNCSVETIREDKDDDEKEDGDFEVNMANEIIRW